MGIADFANKSLMLEKPIFLCIAHKEYHAWRSNLDDQCDDAIIVVLSI